MCILSAWNERCRRLITARIRDAFHTIHPGQRTRRESCRRVTGESRESISVIRKGSTALPQLGRLLFVHVFIRETEDGFRGNQLTAENLRRKLKRRGVLSTHHAALKIAYLAERAQPYYRGRDQRIVERLRTAGVLDVEAKHHDHVPLGVPRGFRQRGVQYGCLTCGAHRDSTAD